jgi:hypothetical protein
VGKLSLLEHLFLEGMVCVNVYDFLASVGFQASVGV